MKSGASKAIIVSRDEELVSNFPRFFEKWNLLSITSIESLPTDLAAVDILLVDLPIAPEKELNFLYHIYSQANECPIAILMSHCWSSDLNQFALGIDSALLPRPRSTSDFEDLSKTVNQLLSIPKESLLKLSTEPINLFYLYDEKTSEVLLRNFEQLPPAQYTSQIIKFDKTKDLNIKSKTKLSIILLDGNLTKKIDQEYYDRLQNKAPILTILEGNQDDSEEETFGYWIAKDSPKELSQYIHLCLENWRLKKSINICQYELTNMSSKVNRSLMLNRVIHDLRTPLAVVCAKSLRLDGKLKKENIDVKAIQSDIEKINKNSWKIENILRNSIKYQQEMLDEKLENILIDELIQDCLMKSELKDWTFKKDEFHITIIGQRPTLTKAINTSIEIIKLMNFYHNEGIFVEIADFNSNFLICFSKEKSHENLYLREDKRTESRRLSKISGYVTQVRQILQQHSGDLHFHFAKAERRMFIKLPTWLIQKVA